MDITAYTDIKSSLVHELWQKAYEANNFHAPFYDIRWHTLWFETLGKDYSPLILSVDDNYIVSFAQKNSTLIFSGGDEVSDYMDLLGPNDGKPIIWNAILQHIESLHSQVVKLANIPESSRSINFFKEQKGFIVSQEDSTPILALAPTWEEYVQGLDRKKRHEFRRKLRKFEHQHPPATLLLSPSPSTDIDQLLGLMKLDERKKIFLTPDMESFFRKLVKTFDSAELLFLQIEGKNDAAVLRFELGNTTFLYNSGYDESNYSGAGWYLHALSIKQAIENNQKIYNFLQGTERYKYDLGGVDHFVYTITSTK